MFWRKESHSFETIAEVLKYSDWTDLLLASMKKFMENPHLYTDIILLNQSSKKQDIPSLEEKGQDLIDQGQLLIDQVKELNRKIVENSNSTVCKSSSATKALQEQLDVNKQLMLKGLSMIEQGKQFLAQAQKLNKQAENKLLNVQMNRMEAEEMIIRGDILLEEAKFTNDQVVIDAGKELLKKAEEKLMKLENGKKILLAKDQKPNSEEKVEEESKEEKLMTDWAIFYRWYHYAGATNKRSNAGTYSGDAVASFSDLTTKTGIGNIKLTQTLMEIFQCINQIAAMREKVLSATGSQIPLEQAIKQQTQFNGHQEDQSISVMHLNTYLLCLEKIGKNITELRRIISSSINKQNKSLVTTESAEQILEPFGQCLEQALKEKRAVEKFAKTNSCNII